MHARFFLIQHNLDTTIDIDECAITKEESHYYTYRSGCGGKCINFPAGIYYECVCDCGFEPTGDAAAGTRKCTGKFQGKNS